MEIILKQTVDNLGQEGEIVKVKPGYARNYLLPQKLAVLVTPEALAQLEEEKAAIAKRLAKEQQSADNLVAKLTGCTVVITRKVGDEDRLFGSVTNADIAENLQEQGIAVDKKSIVLPAPIKTIGETVVLVKAGYKTSAELTVQVMPESSGESNAEEVEEVATDEEQEQVETAVAEENSSVE